MRLSTKVTKEHEEKTFVNLRVPSGQALGARPSWIFSSKRWWTPVPRQFPSMTTKLRSPAPAW